MTIELAFRTGFFCVAFLATVYTRTFVISSAALALLAWMGYGHISENSALEEVLVFVWTWLAAALAGMLITYPLGEYWVSKLERALLSRRRRAKLAPSESVTWIMAVLIFVLAYALTELLGYDRGSFYRIPSLTALVFMMLVVYIFDMISAKHSFHLFPENGQYIHRHVIAVIVTAILVDISVRDTTMIIYIWPAVGVVLALHLIRTGLRIGKLNHDKQE